MNCGPRPQQYFIGRRFGRLVVTREAPKRKNMRMLIVRCSCGSAERLVYAAQLTTGRTKSCGCHKASVTARRNTTHGMSKHPLYSTWCGMLSRCYCPTAKRYSDYGGRGITVSKNWRHDFPAFVKDMGPRPPGTSLDRTNNELGYSKRNCRWATAAEQGQNSRRVKLSTNKVRAIRSRLTRGDSLSSIARAFGVSKETISSIKTRRTWK